MNDKTYNPAKIVLEMHGITYTVEGLDWDSDGDSLRDVFNRLLVVAGFAPSAMDYEGGHDEWVAN